MDRKQIHLFIVISITLIAAYASFVTVRDISDVYHTSVSFFDGSNPYYPWLLTFVVASAPFVMLLIAIIIYKNKKPIVVLFLTAYSLLVYLSYLTILLVLLVAVWLLVIYAHNKRVKNDAQKNARVLP